MHATKNMYLSMGISEKVYEFGNQILEELKERFEDIDAIAEYNQMKVLKAMQKNQVSEACLLGTTGYAAPEQDGLTQTDGRADIYSLGVTMNVMLTGKHPSQGLVKGHLGRVIQRCTMLAPEKRYQTVLDVMEAL